jgi:hypothetical protein
VKEYVNSGEPRWTESDVWACILTTLMGNGVPGGRKSCEEEEAIGSLKGAAIKDRKIVG